MADDSIKREEIKALMDVHAKATEQMVLIAERLKVITDIQNKISDKLSNGLAKQIGESLKEALDACKTAVVTEIAPIKKDFKEIKDSVNWLKILYGVLGLVILIASVILKHIAG